jgi:uracil-DNA glycosylase
LQKNLFEIPVVPHANNPALSVTPPNLDTAGLSGEWRTIVDAFLHSDMGRCLQEFLSRRIAAGAQIYPPQPFRALALTPLDVVRVVILGQDPYHGAGQAEGLAFSVPHGVKTPPSLRNIFKELQRDRGQTIPQQGSLAAWAERGVLLLNTTLTVEDGMPASHAKQGWECLTDEIIEKCAQKCTPVVFMLWGAHAQAKRDIIQSCNTDSRHLVLSANHPSPLSAMRPPVPFMGCGHFTSAESWLGVSKGRHPLLFGL